MRGVAVVACFVVAGCDCFVGGSYDGVIVDCVCDKDCADVDDYVDVDVRLCSPGEVEDEEAACRSLACNTGGGSYGAFLSCSCTCTSTDEPCHEETYPKKCS